LQQVDVDIKADHKGFVFRPKNIFKKCCPRFLFHAQNALLAPAGIDQNSKGKGKIGLRFEVLDGLTLAILGNFEIVFGEIWNESAMLVFYIEEKLNHLDVHFQGLCSFFLRLIPVDLVLAGGILIGGRSIRSSARRRLARGIWVRNKGQRQRTGQKAKWKMNFGHQLLSWDFASLSCNTL
jgi:hypothetical protein